jgi:DNA-binding transcriptional LysR family regulator
MWETVELREIRVFLFLAEELHFGRSAERLGVSPSRVSQTVRQLEAKLGGKLVHRTSRTVRLTAFGERFQQEIRPAHDRLAGILEATEASGRHLTRTLKIGLFSAPTAGPHFFRIVAEFEAQHPECTVEVDDAFPDMFELLRRGEIKLLTTWLPHGQPDIVDGPTLANEPRVLAVGPGHPLAGRSKVSLEAVGDYETMEITSLPRELHDAWIPSRTPSGRQIRRQRVERITVTELAYLVVAGRVVHPTVPSALKSWGHPDIVAIPITDMPPLRSALVWHERLTDETALEFIQVAEHVLRPVASAGTAAVAFLKRR